MYNFLGCEKAKTLSKKGCDKAKTLSKKGCDKAKTLSKKGCDKAKTLTQIGCEKAKTLSKILFSTPQISESIPFLFFSYLKKVLQQDHCVCFPPKNIPIIYIRYSKSSLRKAEAKHKADMYSTEGRFRKRNSRPPLISRRKCVLVLNALLFISFHSPYNKQINFYRVYRLKSKKNQVVQNIL